MKVFGISLVTVLVVIAVWYVARKTSFLKGTFAPVTG